MKNLLDPSNSIQIDDLLNFLNSEEELNLPFEAKERIEKARAFLDHGFSNSKKTVYGINTGFGDLYRVKISEEDLEQLQENLVMSHACGAGDRVPDAIVEIMLLLKARSLSYGNSGVQKETVERLIHMFNSKAFPQVFQQGSLGASGDLAPLAHLALPMLGKGKIKVKGAFISGEKWLKEQDMSPLKLKSKEGLALLNGTQFMGAYGLFVLVHARRLNYLADLIGAISLEAYDGRPEPFDPRLHAIRPHAGQVKTAKRILEFLEGSELIGREKEHVQDPYSIRCMPQVHGASKDALDYVLRVFETEWNSVTDNPNLFPADGDILSGGNFHGQPLALALDHLKLSLHELGSISERRTYLLIGGKRELPAFLVANSGLNSGFMIPQYTAASIVSANKNLVNPASSDSITSSNGQEDHVSMGANAATQAFQVVENLYQILGIELMNASQALYFRKGLRSSDFIESFLESFRAEVPIVENDRVLHDDMNHSVRFLKSLDISPELL